MHAAYAYAWKDAPEVERQPDGRCHNSEPGTFNHECGKVAHWVGRKPSGLTVSGWFFSGFCHGCRARGYEARGVVAWERVYQLPEGDTFAPAPWPA